MGRNRRKWIWCGILIVLLLGGCVNGTVNSQDGSNGEEKPQNIGTLTVCAPEKYKSALQQVFSHINLSQTEFSVKWSSNFADADVVIAEYLSLENHGDYRVLDPQKLQVQGIEALSVRSEQGVIGIPVFLHLDSFWYDQLLYDSHEIEPPQSKDAWQTCNLNGQHQIVCDETDMYALFWSVVAPYYLKSGGSTQELAEGNFQRESLVNALKILEDMREEGFVQLSDQAWQSFAEMKAAYWITCVDNVATYYNHMSTRSSWRPALSLPFTALEKTVCVVRADVLAVRKDADSALTDRFLELFFKQQVLADLSAYSRVPLACQIKYAPEVVPALPQVCYTLLSSPTVDVVQVPCVWSANKQQQIHSFLLRFMNGAVSAAEAAEGMLQ